MKVTELQKLNWRSQVPGACWGFSPCLCISHLTSAQQDSKFVVGSGLK